MIKKYKDLPKSKITIISLLIAVFVIFFVSFINISPEKFTLNSGDAFQYFNFSKSIKDFNYLWMNNGEGGALNIFSYNLFYGFIYLLSIFLKLSPHSQSFLYYFIFLFFSFLSFYAGLGLYKRGIEEKYKIFFSFLYSFNIYTLNSFLVGWPIFTPFLFLYVLIPIFFALTYNFFVLQKGLNFKIISLLGIIFFLSNISNGSMPFFISLNIFLFLFLLAIFLFDIIIEKKYLLKKIIVYYLTYLFAIFWSIVPQISEMFRLSRVFNNQEANFNIGNWVLWQAVKFPNPFFFSFDMGDYLDNISIAAYFSALIFLVLLLILIFKKKQNDALTTIYSVLLVFCIFLLNKGSGILNHDLILDIFAKNLVLSSLRSADKTLIFLPFFVIILISVNFVKINKKKKLFLFFLLFISLISVYPFFIGGIQTRYAMPLKEGENYLTAEYASLNRIPDDYLNIANKLNFNKKDQKSLALPYSVINSVGWVNYPKWKMVGTDPTMQFFNHSIIQPNNFNTFQQWNYGEFWNKQNDNESKWILQFSGFLNSKYIIYHKDVDEQFIKRTQDKIKFYENNKLISKTNSNDYFDVYKIDPKFFLPHFYVPQTVITTSQNIDTLPGIVSQDDYNIRSAIYFNEESKVEGQKLKVLEKLPKEIKNTPIIEFRKINPTKYIVKVHQAKDSFPLVFSESFNEGWKAYLSQNVNIKNQNDNLKFKNEEYKILDGNEEDQASREELADYISKGWITDLGDGKEKEIKHKKWEDNKEKLDYVEKYKIDFVSKNFQGTIQNDNLPSGHIWDAWFKKPLPGENHLMANGYANSWLINSDEICLNNAQCVRNADGSYDLELVIEFWPQRLFYLGLIISGTTLFGCFGYLGYDFVRRRKRKDEEIEKVYENGNEK